MAARVVFGILLLALMAQQAAAGGNGDQGRSWPTELKEDFQVHRKIGKSEIGHIHHHTKKYMHDATGAPHVHALQFELRNIYSNRQNGSRYNFLTKYRYPSSS
ncbi:hypothetical protein VOLCADRAFT_101220, partial [Volvox carteri f. nagariensis]